MYLFLCNEDYSVANCIDCKDLQKICKVFQYFVEFFAVTMRGPSRLHNLIPFFCLNDDDKLSLAFEMYWLLKTNESLSSSFKQKNGIKLCQATWTTHSHSKKFNKILKNFANFSVFSVVFSTKKATGRLVKVTEFIFVVFILCLLLICLVFVPFLEGYVCNCCRAPARQHTILDTFWFLQSPFDPVFRATYVLSRSRSCVCLYVCRNSGALRNLWRQLLK